MRAKEEQEQLKKEHKGQIISLKREHRGEINGMKNEMKALEAVIAEKDTEIRRMGENLEGKDNEWLKRIDGINEEWKGHQNQLK